jgi:DNA repair photolyase
MRRSCCARVVEAGLVPQPIALGINTDAYQPIERKFKLTRQLIEVMLETKHPFSLITKNALVERDIDLLAPLAAENLVSVHFSVTSLDPHLSRSWNRVHQRRMHGCAR